MVKGYKRLVEPGKEHSLKPRIDTSVQRAARAEVPKEMLSLSEMERSGSLHPGCS
jgi:hypothetical protein